MQWLIRMKCQCEFCSADTVCGNGWEWEFFCISCYILEVFPFVLGPFPAITFVCFSPVLLNFRCVFQFPMLASVVLFQPFLLIGFCFLGLAYDFKCVALSRLPFQCLALYSYICKLILNLLHLPLQSPNPSLPDVSGSSMTCCLGCNHVSFYTPQHSSTSCLRFLTFSRRWREQHCSPQFVRVHLRDRVVVGSVWIASVVPLSYRPFTGPSANLYCLSSVKLHWSLLWVFAVDVHGLILLSSADGWFRLHEACAFCFILYFLYFVWFLKLFWGITLCTYKLYVYGAYLYI